MKLDKKDIAVELRTVIDDQGEKELSIIKQMGKYTRKKALEVISFAENTQDFGIINNFITVQPRKVNIKRSGSIKMYHQFMENKRSECVYRHPYGSFFMEIYTKSIFHQQIKIKQQGKVIIEYDAKLNDQQTRHHHLTLTYMEAKR